MAKGKRPRRVPQRTCVGCRETLAKRELVRVVRTTEGQIAVDPTGRRNGRGAYVHQTRECWAAALRKGNLERALKATIDPETLRVLEEYASSLSSSSAPSTQGQPG